MWPTENDYSKAVMRVNPSPFSLLNTKKIKVITDENDQPIKRSGNNSVVFKVSMDEKIYALKCYTKEINNQTHYLSVVQKYVDDFNSSWFIPFELYESEVYVINSENSFHGTYCVLLMPWIEGETLYSYVQKNCKEKNTDALKEIFTEFQQMASWLLQQSFVHGDLNAENIMITPNEKMVMVDHDNILFEKLNNTSGHSFFNVDYQHPKRNQHIINLDADHFSILILAISLRALQCKPALFSTYTNESGLLFTANSLREGSNSLIYQELKTINDAYLQNLLRLFNISINKQTIEVPMLATCIADFDSISYSRLLEIELEELKKDLENSSLYIKTLQAEVSKESATKESLFLENKKLKESIAEIEDKKKKKAALKRSISLSLAGLSSVAVLVVVSFFYISSKMNNEVAKTPITKALPAIIADTINKKENVVINNVSSTTKENDDVKNENQPSEVVKENKEVVANDNFNEKTISVSASLKPRKSKMEKAESGYKMFREGGF